MYITYDASHVTHAASLRRMQCVRAHNKCMSAMMTTSTHDNVVAHKRMQSVVYSGHASGRRKQTCKFVLLTELYVQQMQLADMQCANAKCNSAHANTNVYNKHAARMQTTNNTVDHKTKSCPIVYIYMYTIYKTLYVRSNVVSRKFTLQPSDDKVGNSRVTAGIPQRC